MHLADPEPWISVAQRCDAVAGDESLLGGSPSLVCFSRTERTARFDSRSARLSRPIASK